MTKAEAVGHLGISKCPGVKATPKVRDLAVDCVGRCGPNLVSLSIWDTSLTEPVSGLLFVLDPV